MHIVQQLVDNNEVARERSKRCSNFPFLHIASRWPGPWLKFCRPLNNHGTAALGVVVFAMSSVMGARATTKQLTVTTTLLSISTELCERNI